MRESDIKYDGDGFWVAAVDKKQYTVYKTGLTHSTADSSYPFTNDGLSLAIARCKYLAKKDSK